MEKPGRFDSLTSVGKSSIKYHPPLSFCNERQVLRPGSFPIVIHFTLRVSAGVPGKVPGRIPSFQPSVSQGVTMVTTSQLAL